MIISGIRDMRKFKENELELYKFIKKMMLEKTRRSKYSSNVRDVIGVSKIFDFPNHFEVNNLSTKDINKKYNIKFSQNYVNGFLLSIILDKTIYFFSIVELYGEVDYPRDLYYDGKVNCNNNDEINDFKYLISHERQKKIKIEKQDKLSNEIKIIWREMRDEKKIIEKYINFIENLTAWYFKERFKDYNIENWVNFKNLSNEPIVKYNICNQFLLWRKNKNLKNLKININEKNIFDLDLNKQPNSDLLCLIKVYTNYGYILGKDEFSSDIFDKQYFGKILTEYIFFYDYFPFFNKYIKKEDYPTDDLDKCDYIALTKLFLFFYENLLIRD